MLNESLETLQDYESKIASSKVDIAAAIVAKGGTVNTGDGLMDFAADIGTITNQYTAGDEGKVVSSGALVAQTAYPSTITENGTYNTTENNSVTVDVPTSNYIIIPCTYDSHITDTTYTKGPTQLIINTVNKTVELIVNFNHNTSFAAVATSYIVLTPSVQLSEIFDVQTVFTMNYQALGTKQSTSGGGTYNNSVYPVSTNPFFTIDITNNTISIRSGMYIYGGLTALIKWTYQ